MSNNSPTLLQQLVKPEIITIEDLLKSKYDFKYNLITGRTEFKLKTDVDFKELTDRDFKSLYREFLHLGFRINESKFGCILQSDFAPEYDPFKDYFRGLKWDGADHIGTLADSVKTTKQEFWKKALKKWLVATVSCALNIRENQSVLVLSAEQGKGKTTWFDKLRPDALYKYYYSGTINPHNNDTLINLCETLFINLDELENLNRLELGNLKDIITKRDVRQRRPYERFHNLYSRRASFMGSINDNEFLTDITGNRRYLCFTALEISDHKINMDNVFAQAYHILMNGEKGAKFNYWFDGEDLAELNRNNEDYIRRSMEEELIRKHFEKPDGTNQIRLLTPSEIVLYINKAEGMHLLDKSSLKRIGQVMHRLGFQKRSLTASKPYVVGMKTIVRAFGTPLTV